MIDITAIGEILIDMTQSGVTEQGIPRYDANPGGAPANLAVAASRLGVNTAFVGRVGDDSYGAFLRRTLAQNGVDITGLSVDPREHTTLAVVSLDEKGERSFSFYRDPSADVSLRFEDVPQVLLENTRLLHFGSVSLTAEPSRSATLQAVQTAKAAGALISYDPNYRPSLWRDADAAIQGMREPLVYADILKVSDEELPLLTGTDDLAQGSAFLRDKGIRLVVDESFVDFSIDYATNSLLSDEILETYPHMAVMKSISKSYGVPGLRLGILASADKALIAQIKKEVSIWNLNSFAEFFMQIYNKHEKDYQKACEKFVTERDSFEYQLRTVPFLRVMPSQANYFLCEVLPPYTAKEIVIYMLRHHNILTRDCSLKPGLDPNKQYMRIAVRNHEDNTRLVEALKLFSK